MSSIPYDWARYACPTCGAPVDWRCRTLTTGRVTDAHATRRDLPTVERLQRERDNQARRRTFLAEQGIY
jgi:hypothetical protein